MEVSDTFAIIRAVNAEREEIHALKVGEQWELPQRVHFKDEDAGFDLILTVVKRSEKSKA
jgi:hypothetical protein